MALKLRRAEERFIPQSTRAVSFKRLLDCRSSKTRTSGGNHAQNRLLVEPALILGNDCNDRRIGRGGMIWMHEFEHKTRLAVRPTITPLPFTFGCPVSESLRKARAHDLPNKDGPSRICDAQGVCHVPAEIEALSQDRLQSARLDRRGTRAKQNGKRDVKDRWWRTH